MSVKKFDAAVRTMATARALAKDNPVRIYRADGTVEGVLPTPAQRLAGIDAA